VELAPSAAAGGPDSSRRLRSRSVAPGPAWRPLAGVLDAVVRPRVGLRADAGRGGGSSTLAVIGSLMGLLILAGGLTMRVRQRRMPVLPGRAH